jgi:hypothetical protein
MNTRRINSAAEVINTALTQNRTAAGIALALESTGFLVTPELEKLRARVAELEAERHVTNEALDDAVQELRRRPSEATAKCRCDEPDADPYACEAEECSGYFSELNPFGGGPVQGHDAKVSRTCRCGWHTSEWHVADGSAEEELHDHVTSVHGGVYPQKAGA